MLPWPEVREALSGATKLARFDATGFEHLGDTNRDAWRSFFAAIIVGPMFLMWMAAHGFEHPDTPLLYGILFEAFSYIAGWFLFPVIMWQITQSMNCREHFARFVTAYNWCAVIQNALFIVLNVILTGLGAAESTLNFFGFMLLMYILLFGWFIARHTLGLTNAGAAMIVAIDMATTLAWESVKNVLVAG